ncbi:MAG: helix-turn-helix transcriptional regulator [Clostridia bacterium]|nr:helix-turn-helix transcriptional regulator [Clostridia bacterium]
MNDIVFYNNFGFNEYRYKETVHRDNSMGVDSHFIGFMKHGRGRIVCEGEKIEIAEGEMFYIPKGCRYHSYWIAEDYVRFDSIGFLYFPSETPNGYRLQKIPLDAELWEAFSPLSTDKTVNVHSIASLFRVLALLSNRMIPASSSAEVTVFEKMLQLMQRDPSLTVAEYAGLLEISESLLYQYVKKASGKTPNRLRQEVLCQRARELLVATSYTVEEICDRLNFSSSAYFRKVMHSVFHKTPSEIRKEGRRI